MAFNCFNCALGNNGGSRTIAKSAIVLSQLGHTVEIWSNVKNELTWVLLPPEVPYRKVSRLEELGSTDVLIATGFGTIPSTIKFQDKGLGAVWIRAIETWHKNWLELLTQAHEAGLLMLVNSIWMQKFLADKYKMKTHLAYPGVELDFFTPSEGKLDIPDVSTDIIPSPPVVLGALYHSEARKRSGDIRRVFNVVHKAYGAAVEFYFLSRHSQISEGFPPAQVLSNPTEEAKRDMYRKIDIWFAPTDNEGLHVPPMEAGLCGAALVANELPSAGMVDYAKHGNTALCYGNIEAAEEFVAALVEDSVYRKRLASNLRQHIVEKIGNRRDNMVRFATFFDGTVK